MLNTIAESDVPGTTAPQLFLIPLAVVVIGLLLLVAGLRATPGAHEHAPVRPVVTLIGIALIIGGGYSAVQMLGGFA